jgi:hypothetical protein
MWQEEKRSMTIQFWQPGGGDHGRCLTAREDGPVDLDECLLVVLPDQRPRLRERVLGGAVGRGGGRQPEHGVHVGVAEPRQQPPRRESAQDAAPEAAAAHPPPAPPAPLPRRDALVITGFVGGEAGTALRRCSVDAVVAAALPVRLEAALVGSAGHGWLAVAPLASWFGSRGWSGSGDELSLSLSLSLVGALGVKRLEWCARASRDGAYISLLSSSLRKAHNNEPNLKINHVICRVYSPLILDSSRTHYSNNT